MKKGKREGRIPRTLDANPKERKGEEERKKGQNPNPNPKFSIRMNEKKEIKGKENKSARTNPNPNRQEQTLNLTLVFPHSDKPEKNNSKIERGKKG